jgi:hypothetical protein
MYEGDDAEETGNGVIQEVISVGCVWEKYVTNPSQDIMVAPVYILTGYLRSNNQRISSWANTSGDIKVDLRF